MNNLISERKIHLTFEISILLKGIQAVAEIIGGFIILFTSQSTILSLVNFLTTEELSEDPRDFIANFLIKTANDLSISGQHFVSLYLLSHGIIKLLLVVGLFQRKPKAYPVSILVFTLFIIYQLYRYTFTQSPWLLLFTVFDVVIIMLTVHEYNFLKSHNKFNS